MVILEVVVEVVVVVGCSTSSICKYNKENGKVKMGK